MIKNQKTDVSENGHGDNLTSHLYFDRVHYVTYEEFKPIVEKVNKISDDNIKLTVQINELQSFVKYSAEETKNDIAVIDKNIKESMLIFQGNIKYNIEKIEKNIDRISEGTVQLLVYTKIIRWLIYGSPIVLVAINSWSTIIKIIERWLFK